MLITWIEPHLRNDQNNAITIEVNKQLAIPTQDIASKNQEIEDLKSSFDVLKPFIHDVISHQFENVAKLPTQTLLQRLPAVDNLVAVATNQGVKVAPQVVAESGNKLVNASSQNSAAWNTALALVNYRSSLNAGLSPKTSDLIPVTPNDRRGDYSFMIGLVPKPGTESAMSIFSMGIDLDKVPASSSDSARIESLSSPQPQGSGTSHLYIRGGGDQLRLDGEYLKNVTISGADIIYDGGSNKTGECDIHKLQVSLVKRETRPRSWWHNSKGRRSKFLSYRCLGTLRLRYLSLFLRF